MRQTTMTGPTLHRRRDLSGCWKSSKNIVMVVVLLFFLVLLSTFTTETCCNGLSFSGSSKTTTTTKIKVATYDVFASKQFAGNQLAVFTDLPDDISTKQMQQLAAEMNYAESTFLFTTKKQAADDDAKTSSTTDQEDASPSQPVPEEKPSNQLQYRIFTPEYELPFAGHPTLGTAYHAIKHVLNPTEEGEEKTESSVNSVLLQCKGGIIPVTMDNGSSSIVDDDEDSEVLLWMEQQPPQFECNVDNIQHVATALQCDIEFLDENYPCQVYSTGGTPFLIVAVKNLSSLSQINHPGPTMFPFCHDVCNAVGIYLVTREGHDDTHTISTRSMIAETAVPEDPATGSACGCFAGWAIHNGYVEASSFTVGQGYEMGRPSLLHVNVVVTEEEKENEKNDDTTTTPKLKVQVGGMVIPIIEGGQITLR